MKDNNKNSKTCQTVVFSVYVLWCYKTDMQYVGVTRQKRVYTRIRQHKKGKQFVDKEIKRIGWEGNWDWWIVEEQIPAEQISECEQYWVNLFDCVYPKGYNRTIGGIKHIKHSEATCEQISKANRGKPSAKKGVPHTDEEKANLSAKMKGENNPMYGKHHTTEAKEKNRQSHLGKHHTPETIASISAAVKGENHLMYGKHHKAETIAKMREKALAQYAAKRAAKAVTEENLAAANSTLTNLSTLLDAVVFQ